MWVSPQPSVALALIADVLSLVKAVGADDAVWVVAPTLTGDAGSIGPLVEEA